MHIMSLLTVIICVHAECMKHIMYEQRVDPAVGKCEWGVRATRNIEEKEVVCWVCVYTLSRYVYCVRTHLISMHVLFIHAYSYQHVYVLHTVRLVVR